MSHPDVLPKTDLEDFKQWLMDSGWQLDAIKKNRFNLNLKVVQAYHPDRRHPLIVFDQSDNGLLSVMGRDEGIVKAFLKQKHGSLQNV